MDIQLFLTTLTSVLIMIFYLVLGYILKKTGFAKPDHLPTLSAILLYICTPFLVIYAFLGIEFSWELVKNMVLFYVITLLAQALFMGALFLVFRKKFKESRYRVITIATTLGNVGFFGMPIIKALFPESPEVVCYSSMYMLSMNTLCYSLGAFFISGDKKFISLKGIVLQNPAIWGLAVGIPLCAAGASAYLPSAVLNGVNILGSISGPLCMIILGVRLASAPLTDIVKDKGAYLAAGLKLIVFPLFAYLLVFFLPLPTTMKASVLVLSSTPCAAVILSLAELYKSERETAAHALLLSTLCCFITIPLLTLLIR